MPVNSDTSLLLKLSKMPQTGFIYMQISLHGPMPTKLAPLPGEVMRPKLRLRLKGSANLRAAFPNLLLCAAVPWGAVANWLENIVPWLFFPPSRAGRRVRTAHSRCSSRCFESNCCMPESLEITIILETIEQATDNCGIDPEETETDFCMCMTDRAV